ncbi:MAG: iron ABC transporter permease, partial [Nitrososphaeria archaeon]|nr:iron ABC transporter permease [Nitrososphaeria archaeon]
FFFFVILPSIFVVTYVPLNWNLISEKLFLNPGNISLVLDSLKVSFFLSILVAFIDILFGIPLGFYVARGGKFSQIIDTLVEIPIVTPTSALGFSVALMWPTLLQYTIQSFSILVLLHTAFTIPYMVRSVAAALRDFDVSYEIVSKTLGARPFTTIRTITLPLIRGGILTGTILAIARSLSETGATSVALTLSKAGGELNTAPTLIYFWRSLSEKDPSYIYTGAFVSLMLIIISLALFFAVRLVFKKFHIPFRRVYLPVESELSRGRWLTLRNIVTSTFFIIIAFLPALFPITYGINYPNIFVEKFDIIGNSVMYSFIVASSVTFIDLVFGIPLSLYISRGGYSRYKGIIDYMIEVPIVFPTVAVGISLNLFWIEFVSKIFPIIKLSDLILIIFAHVAITYSFTVRTVVNALNSLDQSFEEAAETLGSTPFSTFIKVVFPQIKFSILAGAIFVFTRSLDETGATLAVAPKALTAPVIIVDFVKKGLLPEAGISALALIIFSYIILLIIRRLGGRHGLR